MVRIERPIKPMKRRTETMREVLSSPVVEKTICWEESSGVASNGGGGASAKAVVVVA